MIEIQTWNALGVEKVDIWQIIKSVKQEVLLAIHLQKWVILLQSADLNQNKLDR